MRVGGIILCGGQSSRMGLPKATLPFGDELMLERVVRLLGQVVQPLVVVAAPHQDLPPLPVDVIVARDERPERGPLEGLYAGLLAIAPHADAAFATSCDVPLLAPDFVRYMINRLGSTEIAVPVDETYHHPLAAVYRTSVASKIKSLLDADRLKLATLFDEIACARVSTNELKTVDPHLLTLRNLNRPADYLEALAIAGATVPVEILEQGK